VCITVLDCSVLHYAVLYCIESFLTVLSSVFLKGPTAANKRMPFAHSPILPHSQVEYSTVLCRTFLDGLSAGEDEDALGAEETGAAGP